MTVEYILGLIFVLDFCSKERGKDGRVNFVVEVRPNFFSGSSRVLNCGVYARYPTLKVTSATALTSLRFLWVWGELEGSGIGPI